MSDIINSIFNTDYINANELIQEKLNLKLARVVGAMGPAFSQARYSTDEDVANPIDVYQYYRNEHLEDIRKNSLMESVLMESDVRDAISNNTHIAEIFLESDKKKI